MPAAHLVDVHPGVLSHLSLQAAVAVAQIHSRPHISAMVGIGVREPLATSGCRQLFQDQTARQPLCLS